VRSPLVRLFGLPTSLSSVGAAASSAVARTGTQPLLQQEQQRQRRLALGSLVPEHIRAAGNAVGLDALESFAVTREALSFCLDAVAREAASAAAADGTTVAQPAATTPSLAGREPPSAAVVLPPLALSLDDALRLLRNDWRVLCTGRWRAVSCHNNSAAAAAAAAGAAALRPAAGGHVQVQFGADGVYKCRKCCKWGPSRDTGPTYVN
jgi:hypothetical protein